MNSRVEQVYEKSVATLDNYLIVNNMRRTQERYLVLRQICSFPTQFTAIQLMTLCCAELTLSRATIYNTLQLFLDAGIVNIAPSYVGSKEVQYELSTKKTSYMQFKCEECGREVAFDDKMLRSMLMTRKYANFIPQHYRVTIYGKCKICRSGKKKTK